MSWEWCGRCMRHHAAGRHDPSWDVHLDYYHGDELTDCTTVVADDAEDAAEKFAEHYDSGGDYTVVGGTPIVVSVRRSGTDDPWQRFRVSGEAVPVYRAESE